MKNPAGCAWMGELDPPSPRLRRIKEKGKRRKAKTKVKINSKNQDVIQLLGACREAVLATIEDGKPFTSSVNLFYVPGEPLGKVVFLASDLARHTKNIKSNPQVSLQVVEDSSVPLYQRKRVSIQGSLREVTDAQAFDSYKQRYLEIFPEAEIFFTLADFHFFELEITELYYIGGFGKIESLR